MKTKTKIMAFVSLASLTMVLLMVGVWALKTVNFTVGGNLSYIAPGIEATISKGTMSNGVWVNAGDASTKMPLTQITRTDTEESLEEKFSYWQDLNLNFNETGDDVTITFSITNDMAEKYLSINVTTSYASADNATISLNTSSANLAPEASQSFTITMKVTDKTANATLSAFAIVFHMEMAEPPKISTPEEVSYLTFDYNETSLTAKLTDCSTAAPETVEIPAMIIKGGKTYNVTSIKEGYYDEIDDEGEGLFYGTSVKEVIIPDTVTEIGDYAFTFDNITSVTIGGGIQTWGTDVFYFSSLQTVIVREGVTSIGDSVFFYCSSLTSISLPKSLKNLGGNAISDCYNLKNIDLPEGIEVLDSACLYRTGINEITIPSTVTEMGWGVFFSCTSLAKVNVLATTPPVYNNNNAQFFYGCHADLVINVPKGSEEAYKNASGWSEYADKIVGVEVFE